MGEKMSLVVEPTKVVELSGVVVQGHPLVHKVHCPYLTQLWTSSMNCDKITKGFARFPM
jgi:hypothetical protein